MSDRQRETTFLRVCLLNEDTAERRVLVDRLHQAQRHERCVRRAAGVMLVVTALALAGLGYSAVFLEDFGRDRSQPIIRILSALGLASLMSLLAFVLFYLVQRRATNALRDECRHVVSRSLPSRGEAMPR